MRGGIFLSYKSVKTSFIKEYGALILGLLLMATSYLLYKQTITLDQEDARNQIEQTVLEKCT